MPRFQIYEDYGSNYEMYKRDIEDAQIGWLDFDRAVEALNLMINPVKSREANRKKALTVRDLLIKVIFLQTPSR